MIEVKIKKINNTNDHVVQGMEDGSLKTILAPFKDARRVFRYHQQPDNVTLVYMRNYMRLVGIWPRLWQGEYFYYEILNKFIQVIVACFALTITCDLYEASKDIILFGDDLVVLIGIYLIFFKMILHFNHAKDIEYIIDQFNKMHHYFGFLRKSTGLKKIRKLQRIFFLVEFFMFFTFINVILLFTAATGIPPILSGSSPYRAKFPFEWKPFDEHPIRFTCIYIFQSTLTFFCLFSVVLMDNLGCHVFSQTWLNLKILCIRIREVGTQPGADPLKEIHEAIQFHQYIIDLVTKINDTYYLNYVAQMGASTFMICLTAFEAMLAQDQPLVAIRFQMYMFSAFAQLLYWCACGNMVYYTSLEVADAAYDIEKWYDQSDEFKYCLKFLIKRAQSPLVFAPKPLFGFNFESFTSILSTSYSYFALLRTMND